MFYKVLDIPPEVAVRRCFFKVAFIKNFAIFTGKHLCWSLVFNNVAGLRPTTSLKTRLQQVFPVSIAKFLRTAFFKEHLRWLVLYPWVLEDRSVTSGRAQEMLNDFLCLVKLRVQATFIHENCIYFNDLEFRTNSRN